MNQTHARPLSLTFHLRKYVMPFHRVDLCHKYILYFINDQLFAFRTAHA